MEGVVSAWLDDIKKMRRRDDHGFVDISAIALNAAISGSILALPDACLVVMMALPFAHARALPPTSVNQAATYAQTGGDPAC